MPRALASLTRAPAGNESRAAVSCMVQNIAQATFSVHSLTHTSASYTAGMETIAEIRARRLRQLIDEKFKGNQAEMARRAGKSPSAIWQYLNGLREMGEVFARDVERKLRLPPYWLDVHNIQEAQLRALIAMKGLSTPRTAELIATLITAIEEGTLSERDAEAMDHLLKRGRDKNDSNA